VPAILILLGEDRIATIARRTAGDDFGDGRWLARLGWFSIRRARGIEGVQRELEKNPLVGKTFSVVDYVKRVNRVLHADDAAFDRIPDSAEQVGQYLFLFGASAKPPYVTVGVLMAAIMLLSAVMSVVCLPGLIHLFHPVLLKEGPR